MGTAFKVFDVAEWDDFKALRQFAGSPADLADGFIHLSSAGQLDETIARHFAGRDVMVAEIDLSRYGDAVRWEASRGGDLFPHIYGAALTYDSVVSSAARAAIV